jgi:hypothetical protein
MTDRQILEMAKRCKIEGLTREGDGVTHITQEGIKLLSFAYHLLEAYGGGENGVHDMYN